MNTKRKFLPYHNAVVEALEKADKPLSISEIADI